MSNQTSNDLSNSILLNKNVIMERNKKEEKKFLGAAKGIYPRGPPGGCWRGKRNKETQKNPQY